MAWSLIYPFYGRVIATLSLLDVSKVRLPLSLWNKRATAFSQDKIFGLVFSHSNSVEESGLPAFSSLLDSLIWCTKLYYSHYVPLSLCSASTWKCWYLIIFLVCQTPIIDRIFLATKHSRYPASWHINSMNWFYVTGVFVWTNKGEIKFGLKTQHPHKLMCDLTFLYLILHYGPRRFTSTSRGP